MHQAVRLSADCPARVNFRSPFSPLRRRESPIRIDAGLDSLAPDMRIPYGFTPHRRNPLAWTLFGSSAAMLSAAATGPPPSRTCVPRGLTEMLKPSVSNPAPRALLAAIGFGDENSRP